MMGINKQESLMKIGIYYFSGTGNTEIIAAMAAKEFGETGNTVELIRIEDILKNNLDTGVSRFDIIGIGNPVIGFGTPDIVFQFILKMPQGNGKKVFLPKTAGGVGFQNYPSSRPVIRKLKKKGYDVFYDRLLSLGSNWVVKFDERVTRLLYEAGRKKVKTACAEIIVGKRRTQKAGPFLTALMEIMMFIDHLMMRFIGLDMHATKECSHCGLCARSCPAGNITDRKGKIRFGLKCNSCMRCVYACPAGAIRYRFFSFFIVPGGYDIRKILKEGSADSDLSGAWKPPFLDEYLKNDNM